MIFILTFAVSWLGWCVWKMRDRLCLLEEDLRGLQIGTASTAQLQDLAMRVRHLEISTPPTAEPPAESPGSVTFTIEPVVAPAESYDEATAPPTPIPILNIPVPPPLLNVAPLPTFAEQMRDRFGDQEWEMLVGGNLLNKLGAFVLVIGIALFLGYSFGHVTPAGRAAMGITVSVTLLAAGVRTEKQGRYRTFARGLIGAGWAALYATSYAIYAIPATRIISDPVVGSAGVLLVAGGMIWHSLRYQSQAVTAVAYFAAFAAMAVTPSSPLALISLIPLAASLLYLTLRFEWHSMAIYGLTVTYLTCISRGSSGAPLTPTQSLFLAYWLLFEAFDLLRVRRRLISGGLDLLSPLNSICFISLSYLTWASHAPESLWAASGLGAILFLADALVRAFVRPPSTFDDDADLLTRLRAGSYEGSFLVAAILAGLAVTGHIPGVWAGVGLAMEAEIVYLAGLRLRSLFLQRLGGLGLAVSASQPFWGGDGQSKTVLYGHATWNSTPPLLFHAVLFWTNRALRKPNTAMSSCAAAIVGVVLLVEFPISSSGAALMLFGLLLHEIGLRKTILEFRAQAWLVLAAGTGATVVGIAHRGPWFPQVISLTVIYGCAARSRWMSQAAPDERNWFGIGASVATSVLAAVLAWRLVPQDYLSLAWWLLAVAVLELGSKRLPAQLRVCFAPMALLAGGCTALGLNSITKFPASPVSVTFWGTCIATALATIRLTWWPPTDASKWERITLRDVMATVSCGASLVAVWMVVPEPLVTVLWTVIAVAIVETSITAQVASFSGIGLAALVATYVRVMGIDLSWGLGSTGFNPATLTTVGCALGGIYWIWHRTSRSLAEGGLHWIGRIQFGAAIFPLILLIEQQMGIHNAPVGWALLSLALIVVGAHGRVQGALLQSYGCAGLAFATAVVQDISASATPRVWIPALTAAGLYTAQYLAKRYAEKMPAWASVYFSLLGTLLLAALLYGRASGGLLTVSWGMEGLALLGFGFALRERNLRLQGLGLLLVCILKLFLYDLRNLETLYRILSFVVLGCILLGVSWIYSRFRPIVRRLL